MKRQTRTTKKLTLAEAFKGVTLLTARPEGMSYEEYVELRRGQTKAIRNCIK